MSSSAVPPRMDRSRTTTGCDSASATTAQCFAQAGCAKSSTLSLIDWWIQTRAAAAVHRRRTRPVLTFLRTDVLVLDLLPIFRIHGLRPTQDRFHRNAVDIRHLIDERILPRVVMRHHAHLYSFIRN